MDDISARKILINTTGLKGGRVLDIGMGDCGCMSFFLARRGFDVVGIDRSPKAIHDSRKEARSLKVKGKFQAKLANAESLPFKDNEFNAVFSYHSMHHMDDPQKVISEMFRVCKTGGFVLVADLHEEGEKKYDHDLDDSFLKGLECYLERQSKSIKKIRTKYTALYICRK